MAFEIPNLLVSFPAASDLSSDQFKCVVVNSSGNVELAGDGVAVDGVLQDKPSAAGRAADVMVQGITKAKAGAAVAQGAQVASNASGLVVTATSGEYILGRALEAAAGSGEIIPVLITRPGRVA